MSLGRKTGGRRKGTPNRATAAVAAAVAASGETPLEFMLLVMRDETQPIELRLEAAARAAPFCHPKLSAVAVRAVVDQQEDVRRRGELLETILSIVDQSARNRNSYESASEQSVCGSIELTVS
jgi:hypothetical protein